MRYIIATLLAGTALSIAPAHAQAPAEDAAESADIIVIGRGETRQVQELQSEDLAILAAGTSPLKAIAKLPSVNFQSADAFGAYEWSQRISIRGFNQQQLGFTLDGIPLGDASYGNTNGLHISRAIITENIGSVRVTQGAGAVGTNATNNLGGTIQFFSRDPGEALGIDGAVTAGSDRTFRGFARIDSGSMDGVRASLSYAGYTTNKWKGAGVQRSDAINSKILIPVGPATITGMFNYSNRIEQDYQDLNLEMINRLGYNADNISDNYALAVLLADIGANRNETGAAKLNPAAGTVYPAPYQFIDDAYFDASGLRRDYLGSLGISSPIGEEFTVALKSYYHSNSGQGTWFTPYVPSPTGVPISVRTTEYDIRRTGVFGSFTHELDWNKLTVTGWYENNDFQQARRFYALGDRTNPGRSARQFQRNPFFTQWEYDFNTQTYQYSVEDLITFGDLTIALGSKGFAVKNRATPIVAGVLASGTIQSKDWFQPHGGLTYKIGDNAEVFTGFTQATRAFTSSSTGGPFATTQAGFNAIRTTLKPEESDTYEIGGRIKSGRFNALIGFYYINFRNRLLGLATGAGIIGNPAVLQNVGDVRSYGFELAGEAKLIDGFSAFASYSYNDSTYRNNVVNGVGALIAATAGKRVVDSPEHLAKLELVYDKGAGPFGRVGVNYMSERFFNYENDRKVSGRAIVDAALGYRLNSKIEIQANATNLFDLKYVATIGSNGFGNRGDNQTLLAGAPQQFFVTVKAGF